jgi:hypothetical protein
MAFSPTLFSGLPFWYVAIRLVLSCCSSLLYPDQNPFAGSGFSLYIVAPCIHRCRFYVSSACPSSLLWVHPTSHPDYPSGTGIHVCQCAGIRVCALPRRDSGRIALAFPYRCRIRRRDCSLPLFSERYVKVSLHTAQAFYNPLIRAAVIGHGLGFWFCCIFLLYPKHFLLNLLAS